MVYNRQCDCLQDHFNITFW